MAIRIARNDAGNCINFFGSSNPTYWNAVLEGEINEDNPNNINVVNTVRSLENEGIIYEFFNLPFTDFVDKDENTFENASECAQYITDNANVSGTAGTFIFSQTDTLDAQREATNTTVLFSNGDIFAVNSLHASEDTNGTIKIETVVGGKDVYLNLRYYNVSVNGGTLSFNNISAAVDRLNEVLSGQAVGSDPGAGESGATTQSADGSFIVYGDRITNVGDVYTSTREVGNFDTSNGMVSTETISEPGEYFEFVQNGNWDSAGTGFTFGLFDETTYDQSDLEVDEAGNAVKNIIRLRIKNTNFIFSDPNSAYGKINEVGFSDNLSTKLTYRLGLDSSGRAFIGYVNSSNALVIIGRTETAIASGTELKLNVIMPLENELDGIGAFTVNTIDTAPALTWYYIESPDGSFYYPLFNSEEQANYVDEAYGTAADDAGSSHQHLFVDEQPSQNIWYMPSSYMFHDQPSAPAAIAGVVWNEILTGDDANYVPTQYADNTVTVDEFTSLNLPIKPAGDAATYNITGIPTGLAFNGQYLVGSAPEVTSDNVANPSDTYTITVTKANDYGSSVGTLTLVVNNTTAPSTALSGFTWDNTSAALVNSTTMGEGSVVAFDDTLEEGKRLIITEAWVEANIYPNLVNIGDEVIIGVPTSTADWTSIDYSDFDISIVWVKISSTIIENYLKVPSSNTNNGIGIGSLTDALYDFGFEVDNGTTYAIACATSDMNTEPSPSDGGSFTRIVNKPSFAGPHTIVIATISAETTLSTSGIGEIDAPVPSTILTSWNKAIKFSGGSEYLQQVSSSNIYNNALRMGRLSQLASANSDSSKTSNDTYSRPWATAVVFQTPNNNTNQHIWNSGEGAGSGDDNMYLRITGSNGACYFGWGREGVGYNEYLVGNFGGSYNQSTGQWWAVYISHDGTRLNSSNATAANLVNAFDIRIMGSNDGPPSFNNLYNIGNDVTRWTSTGVRMDREIGGDFTIGGRGSNRSFHGKVASMVITTLRKGVTKPTDAEIELMIMDPIKWEDDYRVGQTVRNVHDGNNATYNSSIYSGYGGTQIWLMGDGFNDSFGNGIRNQVQSSEQNYTKLQLNSMASNDIENVTISGLS
jgi:hypothetical protein